MKCPNCKRDLVKGCCLRCGYMENGNTISLDSSTTNKFEELKIFNKDFDIMRRNEKIYINLLLGPLYFSYRGHLITGIIFTLLDLVILYSVEFYFILVMRNLFFVSVAMIFYLLFNRMLYIGFTNQICLFIDNIRIKCIKSLYKDKYIEKLEKYKHKKIYLLFNIIICIVIYLIYTSR